MKIFIYGCGISGNNIIRLLKEIKQIDKIYLADSNFQKASALGEKYDLEVIDSNRLNYIDFDYIIISSEKFFEEIKSDLNNYGIDEKKIITYREFNTILCEKYHNEKVHECNICGERVFEWMYSGEDIAIFSEKNIIGGGIRKGICPACKSTERLRLEYYYLKNETKIMEKEDISVLHFAPERILTNKLKNVVKEYISADIEEGKADIIADITNIPFDSFSFDYIICNHVMEHIQNENAAFSELYRCLKKNGILLLTVPICLDQDTFELKGRLTDQERLKLYGQKDHVRLYGKDIVNRIESVGFSVKKYSVNDIEESVSDKYGFLKKDCIFICQKSY